MLNKFVVIDLETTGNLPKKGDRIIQFAAVVMEDGKVTDRFSSLVNPHRSIPPFIEELTGLTDRMVQVAPSFPEIAPSIIRLLDGAFFVAHNVLFDLSFLQEELIHAGHNGFYGPVLDTVEMARILYPTADGYKLSDLAEMENLNHDRPHQADSDAEVTAELLLIMLDRLGLLPQRTLTQLAHLSGGLKSDLDQLLESYLQVKATRIEELPESLENFCDLVLKKRTPSVTPEEEQLAVDYPQSLEEKTTIFKGLFAKFEHRSGQFQMMDEVFQAFEANRHLLLEAGTGIGKSLGYLLPAAYFAMKNEVPVVISTHTIQLQEQLVQREVPMLIRALPRKVKVALLKGRNHYLNLEKFSQSLLDQNDNYDSTLTKMQILIWLTETETGDKDELNLSSGGQIYWDKIKNEQSQFGVKSNWKERDFYDRARKDAEVADLIITNHSLLLRDAAAKQPILPAFSFAVVDEGHHLEKAAASFLGDSLDYLSVRLLLAQFGLFDQKQLFYKLEKVVDRSHVDKDRLVHTDTVNTIVTDLLYEMDSFFKLMVYYVQRHTANRKNLSRVKVRFLRDQQDKETTALIHSGERFSFKLKDLLLIIRERVEFIERDHILTAGQNLLLEEITLFTAELELLRKTISELILKQSGLVMWLEVDFRAPQNTTSLYAQPATVANYLEAAFFAKKKSVVLTSATLSVNQSFDFIMGELGLNQQNTAAVTIPSPFDYKSQVQLLIPEDLPEIKTVSVDEYVIAITEQIITIAETTKGRMLLLFTSHEMLKKTYDLIKESGFLDDFAIIAQGITSGSRTRLTRNFQRYEKAILLGTSSFWEGIDIPGEDLSCLIIVRLPFSPPTEPYTEAKCEYVKQQGGNPFTDYSLPEAILRFKQGFGRLIRTETDRGIIVVFDRRIITTTYGQAFLKSIPAIDVKQGGIDLLVEDIQFWLN